MSGDADTVRAALERMRRSSDIHAWGSFEALAALARLEARAAQRDALAKALREIERWANPNIPDGIAAFARAALAEAATREETTQTLAEYNDRLAERMKDGPIT